MGRGIEQTAQSAVLRNSRLDTRRQDATQIVAWVKSQQAGNKAQAEALAMEEFASSVEGGAQWLTPPAIKEYEAGYARVADAPLQKMISAGQTEKAKEVISGVLTALESPYAEEARKLPESELRRCLQGRRPIVLEAASYAMLHRLVNV